MHFPPLTFSAKFKILHFLAYSVREIETPSALHCAVESGSLATVKSLVQRRPELCKVKISDGLTALGLAVKKNRPTIVRYLLACGSGYEKNESILRESMFYGENQHELVLEIISGLHKEDIKSEMEEVC